MSNTFLWEIKQRRYIVGKQMEARVTRAFFRTHHPSHFYAMIFFIYRTWSFLTVYALLTPYLNINTFL